MSGGHSIGDKPTSDRQLHGRSDVGGGGLGRERLSADAGIGMGVCYRCVDDHSVGSGAGGRWGAGDGNDGGGIGGSCGCMGTMMICGSSHPPGCNPMLVTMRRRPCLFRTWWRSCKQAWSACCCASAISFCASWMSVILAPMVVFRVWLGGLGQLLSASAVLCRPQPARALFLMATLTSSHLDRYTHKPPVIPA